MPHRHESPTPPPRDTMRDALATLTRFSTELSHALDDTRKRSGRIVPTADLSGAHLPVFARDDPPSALESPPLPRVSPRVALARASADRTMANTSGSTCASGHSSRSDGRRRRRDMYRTTMRSQADPASTSKWFVSGASAGTLFDVDDYLITHDDHVWAAPALADASRARAMEMERRNEEQPVEPRVSEGFFDNRAQQRPCRGSRNDVAPMKGVTFASEAEMIEPRVRRQRVPAERSERGERRAPLRAATVQPGRTSLGARAARGAGRASAPVWTGKTGGRKKKSQFVPGVEAQFVKQQSYCKTGHVPGLRRTRFLRLIGSELVCYTRDLNKQLWMVDVQHSFVKISQGQRKVVVFCVGARRPLCFFLASNDMLASWSRALAKASVAAYPRKYTSQKTAKELQREGIVF